jgi:hypothetical protein
MAKKLEALTGARVFNSICQGEAMGSCRLQVAATARRTSLVQLLRNAACVLLQLASDISHCPSKLNNEQKHCCGLLKPKATNQAHYIFNSCLCIILLG